MVVEAAFPYGRKPTSEANTYTRSFEEGTSKTRQIPEFQAVKVRMCLLLYNQPSEGTGVQVPFPARTCPLSSTVHRN